MIETGTPNFFPEAKTPWPKFSDPARFLHVRRPLGKDWRAPSEDLGGAAGDEDGMLEVRGRFAVDADDRPFVGEDADAAGPHVDHGLDGNRHAGLEFRTASFAAVVWDLRL